MELGEYLKNERKPTRRTQGDIAEELGWARTKVWELENDQRALEPTEVAAVARAYRVNPLIVFSFLPQEVPHWALLKRDTGFRKDPFSDESGRGATYRTPRERLAKTENFIAFLTLAPQGKSREHKHPGDEIVFVIRGQVRLSVDRRWQDLEQGDLAHFSSWQGHFVENVTRDEAELLIVRRYYLSE